MPPSASSSSPLAHRNKRFLFSVSEFQPFSFWLLLFLCPSRHQETEKFVRLVTIEQAEIIEYPKRVEPVGQHGRPERSRRGHIRLRVEDKDRVGGAANAADIEVRA